MSSAIPLIASGENENLQLGGYLRSTTPEYSSQSPEKSIVLDNNISGFPNTIDSWTKIRTSANRTVFLSHKKGGTTEAYITKKSNRRIDYCPLSFSSESQNLSDPNEQIADVQLGAQHILILTNKGRLFSYGGNDYGQLGYNTPQQEDASREYDTRYFSNKAKQVKPPIYSTSSNNGMELRFTQIAVGSYHNIALTDNGYIFVWGRNDDGQLGCAVLDGNQNRASPTGEFEGSSNYHNRMEDDSMKSSSSKMPKMSDESKYERPGQASILSEIISLRGTPIRQIAACKNTSYILTYSGDIYAFGNNSFGQLGFKGNKQKGTFIYKIKEVIHKKIIKIVPGLRHVLALSWDKRVFSWGNNSKGQLGVLVLVLGIFYVALFTVLIFTCRQFPKPLSIDIIDIAAGDAFSIFLTSSQKAYIYGQITPEENPISLIHHNVKKVYAGNKQLFLIKKTSAEPDNRNTNYVPAFLSQLSQNSVTDEFIPYSSNKEKEDLKNAGFVDFIEYPLKELTFLRQNFQQEKEMYAHATLINISCLNGSHYVTSSNHSGLNYKKIKAIYDDWVGCEKDASNNGALDYIARDLLPNLSWRPPCIEAIRLYLILPLLPQFIPETSNIVSIHAEYCQFFLGLQTTARKILIKWLQHDVPKEIFEIIVSRFTECVSLLCQQHNAPGGNICIRTPTDPQTHRAYEITDHPNPTSLIVANRAIMSILRFLNILNYVNDRRSDIKKIPYSKFYLRKEVLSKWSWLEDWGRRGDERHTSDSMMTPESARYEKLGMDHFALSFNKRTAFKNHYNPATGKYGAESDKDFDIKEFGMKRHEQYFNLCNFPFCMGAKSKSRCLQLESKTAQEHAHRLTYYQNMQSTFYNIPQGQDQPVFQLYIDRENIVETTFRNLMLSKPTDFKKPLTVRFKDEKARDAEANETAGVRREFFMLILAELLSEKNQYGMFEFYNNSGHMWFARNCLIEDIIDYYQLIGVICGLALYNDNIVDIHFPLALYKLLLDEEPNVDDLFELDPDLKPSLTAILNASEEDDIESWGLTWTTEIDNFGELLTVELCENGTNKPVTWANRKDYVDALVKDKFTNNAAKRSFDRLKIGFESVVKDSMTNIINIFRPEELMEVVVGNRSYNWDELEKNAQYGPGYWPTQPTILTFWNVFKGLSEEQKKKFLRFLTGSDKVPISGLNINFQMDNGGLDRLPQAHTCFNLLDLPPYENAGQMKAKLLQAIQGSEGFDFI